MKNTILVVGKNYFELQRWHDSRPKNWFDLNAVECFRFTNIEELKMDLTGKTYDSYILLQDLNTPEIIKIIELHVVNDTNKSANIQTLSEYNKLNPNIAAILSETKHNNCLKHAWITEVGIACPKCVEESLVGNSSNVTPIHTNKIPSDAKTRLQEEFDQLKERYAKLAIFTESDMFENLDVKKKARLHRQELIMELYLDVLKEQLDND